MRIILFIQSLFFITLLNAQVSDDFRIQYDIHSDDEKSIIIEYSIAGHPEFNSKNIEGIEMVVPYYRHCGYLQNKGKPALPMFTEFFVTKAPVNKVKFIPINSDTLHHIIVYPWQGHNIDVHNEPELPFSFDTLFYEGNYKYPDTNALLLNTHSIGGQRVALIRICPFSFLTQTRQLIFHRHFIIEIEKTPVDFEKTINDPSVNSILRNTIRNKNITEQAFYQPQFGPQNYLIITHPDYTKAAENIALWRTQTGYQTEIISRSFWTPALIKQTVLEKYYSSKRPKYVLLLGDHNKIPGFPYHSWHGIFPTDRPYSFMDGGNDYLPDIAIGRISVQSSQQANIITEKIIRYEKNPVTSAGFYSNAIFAAYFQDENNDTYDDRRFAQTAEELFRYFTDSIGKNAIRVYYTENSVNPLYWNNDYFSAGEPLPAYLQKPSFPWNGNANNIRTSINNGAFMVFHRDHGSETGWISPAFNLTNIASLTNGNKLPVVSSVNCQTGKFVTPVCFAEAFLRHQNGGCVGIFAHAEISFSGYNDALSLGIADAVFAQPGLIPNFTGTGHISGNITPHQPIYTLGDIANQALLRMTQTWGDAWELEDYQHNIFLLFGDPATKIFTQTPVTIQANCQQTLHCTDSIFHIYNCNVSDAIATLASADVLLGMTQLSGGSGIIQIQPTASNNLILTISAPNSIPFIQPISISGNCLHANFDIETPEQPCINMPVVFKNYTSGFYTNLEWHFGQDASPQTATGTGPHEIMYSQPGQKMITLVALSPLGNDTLLKNIFIEQACVNTLPQSGQQYIQHCSGILRDNGNQSPYMSDSQTNTLIVAPGATQMILTISQFDIEPSTDCQDNYLEIYSGDETSGMLIGKFCNNNPPPSQLIIQNDSVSILFRSSTNPGYEGFEIMWQCMQPQLAPIPFFTFQSLDQCGNVFSFHDQTLYQPIAWLWDFGDGHTSTQQHPVHEYLNNGTYSISLTVSNAHGFNSLQMPNAITINRILSPPDTIISICRPDLVEIPSGNNAPVFWFDNSSSLLPFAFTDTLVFYADKSSSTVFCRNYTTINTIHAGKPDNAGPGGFLNTSTVHFLAFDIFQPVKLKSVKVYAQDNGNRTITIRNGNNDIIYSATHYLTEGLNIVPIQCILLPDYDYTIDAGQFCKLYRNGDATGNNLDYPYIYPNIISINRSSATYPNTSKFYYYFYDWELETLCFSVPANKEIQVMISDTTISAWPGTSLCLADSLVISGSNQGVYTWLPDSIEAAYIYPQQQGTYFATIEHNGCIAQTNTIDISGEQFPIASFAFTINGTEVSFTNTSTPANYFWAFGDGHFSNEINPTHIYQTNGSYEVILTASNSCGTDTFVMTVHVSNTGLSSNDLIPMLLFPNPAADFIHFETIGFWSFDELVIYNSMGQAIRKYICSNENTTCSIFVGDLPPGMYYVIGINPNRQWHAKFIKININE